MNVISKSLSFLSLVNVEFFKWMLHTNESNQMWFGATRRQAKNLCGHISKRTWLRSPLPDLPWFSPKTNVMLTFEQSNHERFKQIPLQLSACPHTLHFTLKYVTEAEDALTAFFLELKYIDLLEKTLGFVFGWLDFCSSSPALHCVWHLAILRCACSVQPACVSLWPWSSCTKFGTSLLWEPPGLYGPANQNKEQLKKGESRKELEGGGLILSGISSTSNIFTIRSHFTQCWYHKYLLMEKIYLIHTCTCRH